ncbi:hypothetical protein CH253_07645 [Rhodococcus sp. 06-156-3C]|uniref:SAF domain-containing protein n=1 Tax=Nocardiaceae TaxID=85025 RepID=UPI000522E769|nr:MULTISPECIES: SAF domain-containing protein [Rhodococcus]OZD11720.1 hypothetical protein CH280_18265 [Rhodococcus sp. 06-156-4C]OZD15563.1 hypothetical protein CH248_22885 [Rhodococcus sp. 06-156-4a]OZD23729.1 hypothetical protein CH253_07645 [Rhodococcus sp. 06-156-3C]OZD27198.1 hypothetical protein CH247_22735 [Rhodococcus sp. 06-156-3b]OZD31406.1 hypothetical protein CH284_21715 [Rhodococcus sp. 06-156-3]
MTDMPPSRDRRRSSGRHPSKLSASSRLDATLLDRLSARPTWMHAVLLRRIAAGVLAACAVALFARDAAADDHVVVIVAARDLTPGVQLTVDDVELREYAPSSVPDGAITDVDDASARTLAGPIRAGEPLTDVRLLSSRLAEAITESADARVVPVRLGDPGVTELLRSGDVVDVLTVGDGGDDKSPRILAREAVVVLVSADTPQQRGSDRVVLIAMSAEDATTVAGASLTSSLAVTLR